MFDTWKRDTFILVIIAGMVIGGGLYPYIANFDTIKACVLKGGYTPAACLTYGGFDK